MEGQPEGFWGKLKQDETGRILAWHPLVAHCADVAATTEALLEKTIFNERLARVVGHRELSRPLFLGRKPCLPASRLPIGRIRAKSVREALESAPLADDADIRESYTAWWPVPAETEPPDASTRPVTDARDWANQIHVGERWIAFGQIEVKNREVQKTNE